MLPTKIFGVRSILNNCSIRGQIKACYKVTQKSKLITMSLVRDNIQHKVFKNGPSKICGRHSLKNLK